VVPGDEDYIRHPLAGGNGPGSTDSERMELSSGDLWHQERPPELEPSRQASRVQLFLL
jgi:hypothetical protein